VGSSPIISTTSPNALFSRGTDGPRRQLPRGHLLVLNRSFRRTLEAENKSPRTIEAYTDAVPCSPPTSRPTASRLRASGCDQPCKSEHGV
jgi:hypothetical protein